MEDMLIKERSRDIVSRFKRVIERNSLRYKSLSREVIEQAMVDALNNSLPMILGEDTQSFFAYFDESGELKIEVTRYDTYSEDRYYFFNINLLGEMNIRAILQEFQLFLDYADNLSMYRKIKTIKNGLVYGSVVRYVNDVATVEFYTDDGEVMYGFCNMRHLIENDRSFSALREKESVLFYVRNIVLRDDNNRLDIQLSNRSKRIPELLMKRYLQEYGYSIKDYPMRCIYRIPGQFSKIVVLNRINNDVVQACKDELGDETIRVICVENKTDIAKFYRNLVSFEDLGRIYDKPKKRYRKSRSKQILTNNSSAGNSILDKFKGK